MGILRKRKSHEKYLKLIAKGHLSKGCNLCKDKNTIKKWKHWKIIYALFPYDKIATTHHLLLPIRHTTENKLSNAEKSELLYIKHHLGKKYEYILEAVDSIKSIPGHFHLHLLKIKDIIR